MADTNSSHLIATYTKPGEANIDSLRAISPDSGAYVNEVRFRVP